MFNKLFGRPTLLQGAVLGGVIFMIPVVFYLIVEEASPPLGGIFTFCGLAAAGAWKIIGAVK